MTEGISKRTKEPIQIHFNEYHDTIKAWHHFNQFSCISLYPLHDWLLLAVIGIVCYISLTRLYLSSHVQLSFSPLSLNRSAQQLSAHFKVKEFQQPDARHSAPTIFTAQYGLIRSLDRYLL